MNDRQKELLSTIVTQYIKTAQPVGSKTIAIDKNFPFSPATIRNEMAALESAGYITQPHTSAGRIPTEKGYQFYISHFLKTQDIAPKQEQSLQAAAKSFKNFDPELLKELARQVAEFSHSAVFVGFSPTHTYYTGVSQLLIQPEFAQQSVVYQFGQIIDHFDQVLKHIFDSVGNDVSILIGHRNPFGRDCSTVMASYRVHGQQGVLGILGPLRMDYQHNTSLIRYSINLVNNKQ